MCVSHSSARTTRPSAKTYCAATITGTTATVGKIVFFSTKTPLALLARVCVRSSAANYHLAVLLILQYSRWCGRAVGIRTWLGMCVLCTIRRKLSLSFSWTMWSVVHSLLWSNQAHHPVLTHDCISSLMWWTETCFFELWMLQTMYATNFN
jgi:hypothetical protein